MGILLDMKFYLGYNFVYIYRLIKMVACMQIKKRLYQGISIGDVTIKMMRSIIPIQDGNQEIYGRYWIKGF